jgi:RNA polymerase sigma factor (sigma-70 family)
VTSRTGGPRKEIDDADPVVRSLVDPVAFGEVYDVHADAVFGFFARRVPRAEVPDLVAETFRVAFDARARFDATRGRVRPWLYGVAGNVLRHHLRSRQREGAALLRLGPGGTAVDEGDRVDAAVDAAGELPAVVAALDHLAPPDRDALLLHVWEGLSYAEVAAAVAVPVGTVRSRINRARSHLRDRLDATRTQEAHRG